MKSIFKFTALAALVSLVSYGVISATAPVFTASADTTTATTTRSLLDRIHGPSARALEDLVQVVGDIQQTVAGFADSFTSKHVSTEELCITSQSGQKSCITEIQLAALLAGHTTSSITSTVSGEPTVEISDPVMSLSTTTSIAPSTDTTVNSSNTVPHDPPTSASSL